MHSLLQCSAVCVRFSIVVVGRIFFGLYTSIFGTVAVDAQSNEIFPFILLVWHSGEWMLMLLQSFRANLCENQICRAHQTEWQREQNEETPLNVQSQFESFESEGNCHLLWHMQLHTAYFQARRESCMHGRAKEFYKPDFNHIYGI